MVQQAWNDLDEEFLELLLVSLLCGFNEVPHLKEQMYTKFNWYAKPSEGCTHDAGVMKMQTTLKNQEE